MVGSRELVGREGWARTLLSLIQHPARGFFSVCYICMIEICLSVGRRKKVGKASWVKQARGALYNHQLSRQRNEMKGEMKSG